MDHPRKEKESLSSFHLLLKKGGYRVITPNQISSLCCGRFFKGRGFEKAGEIVQAKLVRNLSLLSKKGTIPIIVHMSSCFKDLKVLKDSNLNVFDTTEFILVHLKKRLGFKKSPEKIMIHEPCSLKMSSSSGRLKEVAKLCSDSVFEIESVDCCGFAGDKGFYQPEVNENALKQLVKEVPKEVKRGFSQSLPCEIALVFIRKGLIDQFTILLKNVLIHLKVKMLAKKCSPSLDHCEY